MAVFESMAEAAARNRIWHPDVTPSGLHSTSWKRGDGVGMWDYPSDETGAVIEDGYGLFADQTITGLQGEALIWQTAPSPPFSITTYFSIATDSVNYTTGGIIIGETLDGLRGDAHYFRWHLQHDNGMPNIMIQEFVSQTYIGPDRLPIYDWRWVSGVYLRVGVSNATPHVMTCYLSLDGLAWHRVGTHSLTFSGGAKSGQNMVINQIGWTPENIESQGGRSTRIPWFRVRTGTGQDTFEGAEGGFIR